MMQRSSRRTALHVKKILAIKYTVRHQRYCGSLGNLL